MKRKLIWSALGSILLFLGGLTGYTLLTTHNYPQVPTITPVAHVTIKPEVQAVANLVNQERVKAGLPALADNPLLDTAAAAKCEDMVDRNYWSHNTPDGAEPWTFITKTGYNYHHAGENLAYGYKSSTATVKGWMNSPGHKENILRATFTEVGTAVCHADIYQSAYDQYVIVQEFATPY